VRAATPSHDSREYPTGDLQDSLLLQARMSCQATLCGMYLRVTRGAFDPSQREAVVAVSKELVREATSRPGVHSCRIGLSGGGAFIAFTEGDSEDSVILSRESLGDLLPKMAAVLQLQSPEMYELVGP
jgi:hypothetical protein